MQLKDQLDEHQMDAGLLYLFWSLRPEKTCLLPSALGLLLTGKAAEGGPLQGWEEVQGMVDLSWTFSRA